MHHISKKNSIFNLLNFIILSLVCSMPATAKTNDCWAEFYDKVQYKGDKFRIEGPAIKKNLLNVNGKNWDRKIESIIVGPKAYVTVYENKNLKLTLSEMANYPVLMKSLGITKQDILEDSELIFRPNSKIHNLADFNFNRKIRSLKIECVK